MLGKLTNNWYLAVFLGKKERPFPIAYKVYALQYSSYHPQVSSCDAYCDVVCKEQATQFIFQFHMLFIAIIKTLDLASHHPVEFWSLFAILIIYFSTSVIWNIKENRNKFFF